MGTNGRTRKIPALACIVLFLASAAFAEPGGKSAGEGQHVGDFSLTTVKGGNRSFESIRKENPVLVLSFFGLRCGACIEEIPSLNKIYGMYRGQGIEIFGINVDGVDGKFLAEYLGSSGIRMDYPVAVDPDFRLVEFFGMQSAPLTLVLDSTGTIRYRHEGYKAGDEAGLESAIAAVLKETSR